MNTDSIIYVACIEADLEVSWKTNQSRVQEYIRTSAGLSTPEISRSWCGDFAYWVLKMAGVTPLPPIARAHKYGWDTVGRFGQTYKKRTPGTYTAKPGDMFYMPKVRGKGGILINTDHVGFVMEDKGGSSFRSLDGNGKGGGNWSVMTDGEVGGGYVSYAKRERHLVNYFIEIPN